MDDWSAKRLLDRLAAGEISSVELVQQMLARIESRNPALNAVVTLDADAALAEAGKCDAERRRGQVRGPLHGLPITVKDTFESRGLRTTAGSPEWAGHRPRTDAVAVARLRDAGAILVGKTNTAERAGDLQCDNPLFGTTRNPWDTDRTSGGSSGGSAAALAAGLTSLELGSDIGGSIRLPAHFCGVCGHKPSYGLVPMRGHLPGPPGWLARSDLAVAGPMAREVADLRLALDVLAGPDPADAVAWRLSLPEPAAREPGQWRMAVWLQQPPFPLAREVLERLQTTVAGLDAAGVVTDADARPSGVDLVASHELFYSMLAAAMSAGLSPGEARFGRSLLKRKLTPEDGDRERFYRAAAMSHRHWQHLHEQRLQLAARWERFFRDWDVLLCPVAPVNAFAHDLDGDPKDRRVLIDGHIRPYSDLSFWCGIAGLPYLPATVVPVGSGSDGLPVAIQVIGPRFGDNTTLAAAALIQQLVGGFRSPPGPFTMRD